MNIHSTNTEIKLNKNPPEPNSDSIKAWLDEGSSVLKEQAQEWVNAHHEYYRPALMKLVNNIKRVSHKNFKIYLKRAVIKFNDHMDRVDNKKYTVLVEPKKSNQWVAELALSNLVYKPTECLSLGAKEGRDYVNYLDRLSSSAEYPERIVLFDDASYSGTQLANHVESIFSKFKEISSSNSSIKLPIIHVIVPFSTKYAHEKLESLQYHASGHLEITSISEIPSVDQLLTADDLNRLRELYGWGKDSVESKGRSLIYFDHKIPNGMSFVEPFTTGSVFPGKNGHEVQVKKGTHYINLPEVKPPYKD